MFGEKTKEKVNGQELEVWKSPRYEAAKNKAIELIKNEAYGLTEGDFWILMNRTKGGKMAYTGLIISHNGCLKINDKLTEKFNPDAVKLDKEGYKNSLVFSYCDASQGLYEVGEVNPENCKNDYPYAMAFKRLFDRVVLKLSKIAYDGIYGEDEADSFKNPYNETTENEAAAVDAIKASAVTEEETTALLMACAKKNIKLVKVLEKYGGKAARDLTKEEWLDAMRRVSAAKSRAPEGGTADAAPAAN